MAVSFGKTKSRKKRYIFLLVVVAFCSLVYFFRHTLLVKGVEVAISSFLPKSASHSLAFESIECQDGKVVVSGMHLGEESYHLTVDRMEVDFHFSLFPFYIEPKVHCIHPELTLIKSQSTTLPISQLGAFLPRRFFGMKFDIQNGVLQLHSHPQVQRLYFKFASGNSKEKIGTFFLSYDPSSFNVPLLFLDLEMKGKELAAQLQVQGIQSASLFQLISFFYPQIPKGWEEVQGEIVLSASTMLQFPLSVQELNCELDLLHLSLTNPILGLHAQTESFHGTLSYPGKINGQPLKSWEDLRASFSLQGGESLFSAPLCEKEWGFSEINADFVLEPNSPPAFNIVGAIQREQKNYPLNIQGKGSIHSKQSFWLELALSIADGKKEAVDAFFSFCRPQTEQHIVQADLRKIDPKGIEMLQDILAITYANAHEIKVSQGEACGKFTFWFDHGICHRLEMEDVSFKDLSWSWPTHQAKGFIKEFNSEARLDRTSGWKLKNLKTSLQSGRLNLNALNQKKDSISDIEAQLEISDGKILPSFISASGYGIDGKIEAGGSIDELELKGEFFSNLQLIAPLLFKEGAVDDRAPLNIGLSTTLKMEGNDAEVSGMMHFAKDLSLEETLEFGFSLPNLYSFNLASFANSFKNFLSHGWFRSEKLSSIVYASVIKAIDPSLALQGDLDIFGSFDGLGAKVFLQGSQLQVNHPLFRCEVDELGQKDPQLLKNDGRAIFSYDAKTGAWQGLIPIVKGRVVEKKLGLEFTEVNGNFKLDDSLHSEDISAITDGIKLKGSVAFQPKTTSLEIRTQMVEGSAQNLTRLVQKIYPQANLAVGGTFISGADGFYLNLQPDKDPKWRLKGSLQDISTSLSPQVKIDKAQTDVVIDSKDERLTLSNLLGNLSVNSKASYQFNAKTFQIKDWKNPKMEFDCNLLDQNKEILRLAGTSEHKTPSIMEFSFDRNKTHFFGTKLDIQHLSVRNAKELLMLKMQPLIKVQELMLQMDFLSQNELLSKDSSLFDTVKDLDGSFLTKIEAKGSFKSLNFQVDGKELKYKGGLVPNFSMKGQRIGNQWVIENLTAGELFLKASLSKESKGWNFPALELKWKDVTCKGTGFYSEEKNQFAANFSQVLIDLKALEKKLKGSKLEIGAFNSSLACTVDLPSKTQKLQVKGSFSQVNALLSNLRLSLQNEAPLKFEYFDNLLVMDQMAFRLSEKGSKAPSGSLNFEQLKYDIEQSKGAVKKCGFSLSTELMQSFSAKSDLPEFVKEMLSSNILAGSTSIEFAQGFFQLEGYFKSSIYKIFGYDSELQDFNVRYDKGLFALRFKQSVEKAPIYITYKASSNLAAGSFLTIQDDPKAQGVTLTFKTASNGLICEGIQGSLRGLDIAFSKNTNISSTPAVVLSGKATFDGKEFAKSLPFRLKKKLESLKIGKGYELGGNLILSKDKSQFNGSLRAHDFELLGNQMQNLQAQIEIDESHGSIRNVSINDEAVSLFIKQVKLEKTGKIWTFDIPLVQVQDLRPSLLKKVGSTTSSTKPLLVRSMSFFDFCGEIGDTSTFSGRGHLLFSNAFKKEFSFLDIPLDMIKNIGLDPGLMTPINGEIDYELKGNKLFLTDLRNAYSEGKRSEFYLSQEPSFIDLDGNLSVKIKMRQNVMLKITEALTLTVRGTIEKPSYSFIGL